MTPLSPRIVIEFTGESNMVPVMTVENVVAGQALTAANVLRAKFDAYVNEKLFPKLALSGTFMLYVDDFGGLRISWTHDDLPFLYTIFGMPDGREQVMVMLMEMAEGIVNDSWANKMAFDATVKSDDGEAD